MDRGGRESRDTRRDASTGPQAQGSSEGGKEGLREERKKRKKGKRENIGWNDSRSAAQSWCAGGLLGAEGSCR